MKYSQTVNLLERGILTSTYKQEIKRNLRETNSKSLSHIKFLILNHQGKIESQMGTILRVSLFMIAFIMAAA